MLIVYINFAQYRWPVMFSLYPKMAAKMETDTVVPKQCVHNQNAKTGTHVGLLVLPVPSFEPMIWLTWQCQSISINFGPDKGRLASPVCSPLWCMQAQGQQNLMASDFEHYIHHKTNTSTNTITNPKTNSNPKS